MKIGIIFPRDSEAIFDNTSFKTFGGATVQMFTIANALAIKNGYEIICFTPKIHNKSAIQGTSMRILDIFNRNRVGINTLLLFLGYIIIERPNVIIQHGLTLSSCLFSLCCKILRIKYVFMFASDVEVEGKYQSSQKKCYLFNILIRTATILVTQNKYQKDYLLNTKKSKSILIRMGFQLRKPKTITRENILWIGRCAKEKQPEIFMEIAKKFSDYKFVMVCPKEDEVYFKNIKERAKTIANLIFIDFVNFKDTWGYFEEAKIFINTSFSEGFPQTFAQSVVCGVPIISLKVNPDNFITNYNCGFVCDDNVDLLGFNLKTIMENRACYNRILENSLLYAQKYHDIDKNVTDIINAIKQ